MSEQPYAEVTQVGRWTYSVLITDGLMTYGPSTSGRGWLVLGRGRADRKAERKLARYLRKQSRVLQSWRVDGASRSDEEST